MKSLPMWFCDIGLTSSPNAYPLVLDICYAVVDHYPAALDTILNQTPPPLMYISNRM